MAQKLLGAGDQAAEGNVVEPFQDEDLAAGQQRPVEFKAGILCGRANEHDGAVLDVGQKGILLGAIKAVDLVDKQQGALANLTPSLRRLEDLSQIRDAGKCGR